MQVDATVRQVVSYLESSSCASRQSVAGNWDGQRTRMIFSFHHHWPVMPAIEVSHLTKAFRTYKKQPGFGGAVKGLFRRKYEQTVAVKDVISRLVQASWLVFSARTAPAKPRP